MKSRILAILVQQKLDQESPGGKALSEGGQSIDPAFQTSMVLFISFETFMVSWMH